MRRLGLVLIIALAACSSNEHLYKEDGVRYERSQERAFSLKIADHTYVVDCDDEELQ